MVPLQISDSFVGVCFTIASIGLLAANIISTLNQRLLASILLTYYNYNLSIKLSALDDISSETKHLTLKPKSGGKNTTHSFPKC